MGYAFDNAELSDLARESAASERSEYLAASRRGSTGTCPPGQHQMAHTRGGGGVCPCGFEVSADEL